VRQMNKRIEEVLQLGKDMGLDPFPIIFETVERSTMFNVCAYGLPVRARHWSYGRSYDHTKTHGEMGFSKVYEIILNNNPSYAFMLDTNSEVQNLFIAAHCLAHADLFKNNYMFKGTDRNMIRHAAEHAVKIEEYIGKFGFERVERMMDIGFALDGHLNWNKGLYRQPYPKKSVRKRLRQVGEFDDLVKTDKSPGVIKEVINQKFPPSPEKDLLWFFINYAPLEDWERDVLDMIREESYYFYPQGSTKCVHEGWASYWHAEIMYNYDGLSAEEHLDFARNHEKVVQPGPNPFRINPYYLGFVIFKDIEKRWDELEGPGAGRKKIFQVAREENDISFIQNYLTADLIKKLKLFTYGYEDEYPEDYVGDKFIEIKERIREEVVEALVRPMYNGGVPKIVISDVGQEGTLIMKHESEEFSTLDFRYAEKTLEYIWDLWAAPIELDVHDDEGKQWKLCFDEAGFYKRNMLDELYGEEEKEEEKKEKQFSLLFP